MTALLKSLYPVLGLYSLFSVRRVNVGPNSCRNNSRHSLITFIPSSPGISFLSWVSFTFSIPVLQIVRFKGLSLCSPHMESQFHCLSVSNQFLMHNWNVMKVAVIEGFFNGVDHWPRIKKTWNPLASKLYIYLLSDNFLTVSHSPVCSLLAGSRQQAIFV